MSLVETHQVYSYSEPVTGLPNRVRLLDDIDGFTADAAKHEAKVFLVAIDLLDSRPYNEMIRALGHVYVDGFIISAARLLQSLLPDYCRLYHLSHYRFAVLLSARTTVDVEVLVERLTASLRQPIVCTGIPISIAVRMGIAEYPGDADNAAELLRAAVTAANDMQFARVAWARYGAKSDQAHRRRFQLLSDMTVALRSDDQFMLHYQPKIELSTAACVGFEALLRWRHPELGMIPPGEFIPLVERTALIGPVTEWVLKEAVRQLAAWQADISDIKIAINVSTANLLDEDFPRRVGEILARHEVDARRLEFEITESALMRDQGVSRRQLDAIREMGIDISIDDFGTGQSAMSYLKHIPANAVKIDQIFVRALDKDPVDRAIVKTMIELAHNLKFRVVAEGIETEKICTLLAEMSCDEGQGYWIARPLPSGDAATWARNRAGTRQG